MARSSQLRALLEGGSSGDEGLGGEGGDGGLPRLEEVAAAEAPRRWRLLVGGAVALFALGALTAAAAPTPHAGAAGDLRRGPVQLSEAAQPSGLLCWLVSRSSGRELELVKDHHRHQRSIFACDESIVFSDRTDLGPITAVSIGNMQSKRAPWGGWYNTEVFLSAWDELARDGRFAAREWIVKVDADAVFFPDRLKAHLAGSDASKPVFLKGGATLLGALEVFSNAAVQVFADKRALVCTDDIQGSGEDGFINNCMGLLGVEPSIDGSLLLSTTNAEDCKDRSYVAFHPFVDARSVSACYRLAEE